MQLRALKNSLRAGKPLQAARSETDDPPVKRKPIGKGRALSDHRSYQCEHKRCFACAALGCSCTCHQRCGSSQ